MRDFLAGTRTEGLGSNNWVVDGTLTASGKPLLANDPHLGTRLPSTWYLAHISAGEFEVIGGTFPGIPAVALGRNRSIAWGATNVAADVQDLYREHLDAAGTHAEFRGEQEPITVIPETIVIKGAAPVTLNVRVTRHGPLVSDAINANNADSAATPKPQPIEPLAFRWTALDADDGTLTAFLKLNEAHNWTEFTDALRGYVVPSQNFVYADVAGHIGYYAPGRIPLRASGDGSQPADGWSGNAEWTGWVPFDELPHLYDPPEHFIVTANHRPAPPTYPYNLGLEWTEPYRAQRITDLIVRSAGPGPTSKPRFTPDDFARIQADTVSLHARALLPILLKRTSRVEATGDRAVLDILRGWNFDATRDSAATAIFQAWFLQLTRALVADELGPAAETYAGKFSYVARFLARTLTFERLAVVRQRDDTAAGNMRRGGGRGAERGHRRSAAPSRQRHDALAVGRRASRDVPARARLGRRAAADPQPLGRDRRRLEHGQRRRELGRSSVRGAHDPRLPRDHRPLAGQRQPLSRRGRRIRPSALTALRRLPPGVARGHAQEDAYGSR